MKTTITKIKKHNFEAGFTFFDKDRLNLMDGKVLDKVYCGNNQVLFLMSSKDHFRRVYHICEYDGSTGFVGKLLGTIPYSDLSEAKEFAQKLTHVVKKRTPTKKKRATKKKPTKNEAKKKTSVKKKPTKTVAKKKKSPTQSLKSTKQKGKK